MRTLLFSLVVLIFVSTSIYGQMGPTPVDLGTAENFAILAQTGVSTTGTTSIVGNIGLSPAAATFITGFDLILDASGTFSTSALVTGQIYAADYTEPTPTELTTAVGDVQTAYADAAGRVDPDHTELHAGDLTGQTLVPGLYYWSSSVLISAGGLTIEGGADDVWIFQIAQDLTVGDGAIITLSGGAKAENIFWQVAGQSVIGTTVQVKGIILCATLISLNTDASVQGRLLAQTAVTLIQNAVTQPISTLPEDEMVYNHAEEQYEIVIPGFDLNLVFKPTAGQPLTQITVEHSNDPAHPSVQLFPNPSAIGNYFKFLFADPSVLGAGGELTLEFSDAPGQIWYRQGGNWSPVPWIHITDPDARNHAYTIDLTALDVESGDIEFAGDNGVATLPVELSSFTANVTANMFVELQWISETETNMLGYNVFRSSLNSINDATQISSNTIPAYNSSVTTIYNFVDKNVYPGETYYYWLEHVNLDLTNGFHGPVAITLEENPEIPEPDYVTSLRKNFPNPFNPETTINFSLREDVESVELVIFNLLGQVVRTLVPAQPYPKGEYQILWDGKADSGNNATSGVYFYRMTTPNYNKIHKMMLLK